MLYFGDAGRVSPYPSPNASPRVGYTALELKSDLTFGNGDNKSGSGIGMGWVNWVNLLLVLVLVTRLR